MDFTFKGVEGDMDEWEVAHFLDRLTPHRNELPVHIPRPVIFRLKSIMGLGTQGEIISWHEFCAAETEPSIKNWDAHKLANPPSINKFLSKNTPADWDVTPNHLNYVETVHNSETSVGVRLLAAILQAQEHDNIKSLFRHLRHFPWLVDEPKPLAEKITNESDVLKKM
ncbi:hypothetical protein C8J57DRAFT_1246162 [Mycena rebaudengoi]|nr:hypothetical protein C8J57DRAFT_1246162 [Mycena rebaudengoi]